MMWSNHKPWQHGSKSVASRVKLHMTASLPEKPTSLESILNSTDPLDPLVMKVLDDISKEGVPPNVEDFAEFEEY